MFFHDPHSPELARQAKGCPQNYMGVLGAAVGGAEREAGGGAGRGAGEVGGSGGANPITRWGGEESYILPCPVNRQFLTDTNRNMAINPTILGPFPI